MSRIRGVAPEQTSEPYIARVLKAQAKTWGGPLLNHLVYARRPALFKAVRGMWAAVDKDGLVGAELIALVNRRVAHLNGCVF
jgi:hypothetical protein